MISAATTEAVLDRLGFSVRPAADRAGLHAVYAAWCERVRFDNLIKRIHLAAGDPAPIPNGPPEAFFASYLEHGTGGTCWPSSGALFALLDALGFDARRGSAAMADDQSGPIHSHGTVIVRFDTDQFWVDSSMLTRRALPLVPAVTTRLDDRIDPVRAEPVGDLWRVFWRYPVADREMGCLLLDDDVDQEHYLARYEWSRGSSPFNTAIYATRNSPHAKTTYAFGNRFERTTAGLSVTPVPAVDRDRLLVEEFGYSEAIVASLPPDDPPSE